MAVARSGANFPGNAENLLTSHAILMVDLAG